MSLFLIMIATRDKLRYNFESYRNITRKWLLVKWSKDEKKRLTVQ